MAKKKVNKRKILYWIVGLILGIYALSMLIPCWFLLINSLKSSFDYQGSAEFGKMGQNAFSFPRDFIFNYKSASKEAATLAGGTIVELYINSIILTFVGMALGVVSTVMTAYACARFKFRGQGLVVGIGVGALVFPDFGSAAVIYNFFVKTNLIETWGVLLPGLNPFGMMFLIVYGQFRSISGTYAEAAKIDGASELRIMIQIMVPMIKGVIGMMIVMSAIGSWNNYYVSYMYLTSKPTIAYGMYLMMQNIGMKENIPMTCAIMVLCILPLVVLFICMRDTIISNTAAGGLKG